MIVFCGAFLGFAVKVPLIPFHTWLPEAYAEAHRNDDARKQIDALLAMKPLPDYVPEYQEAVAEAKKLQDKIK